MGNRLDNDLGNELANAQINELDHLLAIAGLGSLDAKARKGLVHYVGLLQKWNRVWNLTAVRDPATMLSRHVMDSLSLLSLIDEHLSMNASVGGPAANPAPFDLLDIGSGAGLPVLPLAIARPGLRCLSIERTDKKARFQRQVVLELGLDQVDVRSERIEQIQAQALIVTSRAFTAPAAFLELASAYTAPNGLALVMLGRAERLPETLPRGWVLLSLERVDVPGGTEQRHIAKCQMRGR